MAIGSAIQRGNTVYVYDENNRQIWVKQGTLIGYTSNTLSVKVGDANTVSVYNDKGHHISSRAL